MRWLISYRYRYGMRREHGVNFNAPDDRIEMIDIHPAVHIARAKRAISDLHDTPYDPSQGLQTASEIVFVYSAIEIPDGLLSDADIELFE